MVIKKERRKEAGEYSLLLLEKFYFVATYMKNSIGFVLTFYCCLFEDVEVMCSLLWDN